MNGRRRNGFTLIEIIVSFCVLAVCASSFYSAMYGTYRLQRLFIAERDALIVLGNVLERAKAAQVSSEAGLRAVLEDEFGSSALRREGASAVVLDGSGMSVLRILRSDGKILAETRIAE